MIDFLKDINIDSDIINKIVNNNNDSSLFEIVNNQEECIKIIEYLRKIGITCINELLIYEIDLFKKDLDYIIKKISKFNIPVFVNIVNDEYTAIENIYNVD